MSDTAELMPIGRFSSLSRTSVRMLRHYDAHGVLVPAHVDSLTGYRRYDHTQLADAAAIRRLRDVGFSVSAIGALLAIRGTPPYQAALVAQRRDLADEVQQATDRLRLIDRMITQEESTMNETVTRTDLDPTTLVYLRGTVPDYAAEGRLWERFVPLVQHQAIVPTGPGGCIEHDDEFREVDVDESVFFEVPPGTVAEDPLTTLVVPARRAVVATVCGPYHEAIPRAHDLIARHIAEHGLALTRVPEDPTTHHFNVYLNDPTTTEPAQLLTRVYAPVR